MLLTFSLLFFSSCIFLHISILLHFSFLLQHITVELVGSVIPPCANCDMFLCSNYLKLKRNWHVLVLKQQYSPHQVSMLFWLLKNQISLRHTLTHFAKCSLAHITFPSFLQPTFWQCHWSPCHVDIYNSQISNYQFRKQVISYHLCFFKITHNNAWFHYETLCKQCVLFYCV